MLIAAPAFERSRAPSERDVSHAVFDLITTRDGFDALEDAWNDLFARSGRDVHLFQTFSWLWHWANHFLDADANKAGRQLAIVTGRIDGELVMVWPLISERVGPFTRLSWMGAPVSQYGDVLVDDGLDALPLLRSALAFVIARTSASVIQLRKVRADATVAPLLAEAGVVVGAPLAAPYVDLRDATSFADIEARYSGNARRNRKRQRRRLAERGPLTLESRTGGDAAEKLTREAFRLKAAWMRQRGILSQALSDPRTERFFIDVARGDRKPAGCHVKALLSDSRPVAIEIGIRCMGRSAIHIITYDLAYEKTGAGSLLMEDSIRCATDDGLATFDFLAPADAYKLEWAGTTVAVQDWSVALTPTGRLYTSLYLNGLRAAAKRCVDATPTSLRRKLVDAFAAMKR